MKATDTYGVLGNPGSPENQIPRHGDGKFEALQPGQDPNKPTKDRNSGAGWGYCSILQGTECQLQKLKDDLQKAVDRRDCPSCGSKYRNDWWKGGRGFNNSNTF